jgi:hypothetical protein
MTALNSSRWGVLLGLNRSRRHVEKEMNQVHTQYQDAEQHFGSDLLKLVVAKGFITKLLANESVKHFSESNDREILAHFELVINTVSVEETVQQQQGDPVLSVEG